MTRIKWLKYCKHGKTINYGNNLFGEIGKLKKFTNISRHRIKAAQFLDSPVLEIVKYIFHQIVIFEKNIISAKYCRFTVVYFPDLVGILIYYFMDISHSSVC